MAGPGGIKISGFQNYKDKGGGGGGGSDHLIIYDLSIFNY